MGNLITAYAQTPSKLVSYSIEIFADHPNAFTGFVDTAKFNQLCAKGCVNYQQKWSCPPFSPSFQDYTAGWKNLFILYMRINTDQFSYIKNDYLKIKAANSILKSRADKYLRKMAAKYGNYISTGSCRLCKPCKRKSGNPCACPETMTYSFEALGVNVGALAEWCFHTPLLWYKTHYLPEYTSVVCGLLTNKSLSIETLSEEYLNYIIN